MEAEGHVLSRTGHNHHPSPDSIEIAQIMADIRREAAAHPAKPAQALVADATRGKPEAILAKLSDKERLERSADRLKTSE